MFYVDPTNRTAMVRRVDSKEATAGLGNKGVLVASADDLMEAKTNLSNSALVEVYNSLADQPIQKFSDRESAVKRTWAMMTAAELPEAAAAPSADAPEAEAKPAKTGGRGRKPGSGEYAGKTVFALRDTNPRRAGTHGFRSFEIIRGKPDGVPYAEYIEAGGRPNDLRWDIDRKWAEVK